MSRTTIDQLFQITTPTSTGRDSTRPDKEGGDLFRAHLKRAADVSDAKQPAARNREQPAGLETAPLENDEPRESQTKQREATSAEQDEPQATTEPTESTEETSSVDDTTDETGDEVTLSSAAAASPTAVDLSEIATTAEQASSTEVVVETLAAEQQQPTNENLVASVTGSTTVTAAATEAETEAGLQAAETPRAAIEGDSESSADGEGEQGSPRQQTSQSTITAAGNATDDATPSVVPAESTARRPTTAQSQAAHDSDASPEPEVADGSYQRGEGKSHVLSPAQANLGTSTSNDTELASNTSHPNAHLGASEANAGPMTSANSEAAIGDRSIGGGVTNKVAEPANSASGRESSETPTIDRARFAQRVGGAIRTAQQGDGQIQLRLSPPELGTLKIQITVTEGAITARLETETVAARTLLLDNLPALRERLAELDIRIEKFNVDVGRDDQQPTDHPSADQRQASNSRAPKTKTTNGITGQELGTTEANTNSVTSMTSGLDVRV